MDGCTIAFLAAGQLTACPTIKNTLYRTVISDKHVLKP
jgi:hypothetical protein